MSGRTVIAFALAVLAFVDRHWGLMVLIVAALLVKFVFIPRQMDTAVIVTACVGAGAAVGHWWVG